MANTTLSKKKFKNTFAPLCISKELDVDQIICGLRSSGINYNKLPPEVQAAVDPVLAEMHRKYSSKSN